MRRLEYCVVEFVNCGADLTGFGELAGGVVQIVIGESALCAEQANDKQPL